MIHPLGSLAVVLVLVAVAASPAGAATLAFYNGVIASVGSDSNCISSMTEIREQAYDGFTVRNGYFPAAGETWYAHVLISHPGNPCSGGSYTGIEILPPANTVFAISAADPVYCAFRNSSSQVSIYYRQDQGCPQAPLTGLEGYAFPAYSNGQAQPWPIAAYTYFELMIPLRSSTALNGQTLRFRVNPDVGVVGYADVGVFVQADTIFRTDFADDALYPDICSIPGTVSCNLVQ